MMTLSSQLGNSRPEILGLENAQSGLKMWLGSRDCNPTAVGRVGNNLSWEWNRSC